MNRAAPPASLVAGGCTSPSSSANRPAIGAERRYCLFLLVMALCLLVARTAAAQGLTGALIGTVTDEQGGVLAGARVRISSPALIGGHVT